MSIFLAVVAFFMAFGALWFTSEVARRMDFKNQTALQPHMGPLRDSLRRAEQQIRELALGLEAAERQIQEMSARKSLSDREFSGAGHAQNGPASNVTTLDILRGAQRFYPSDTYKN